MAENDLTIERVVEAVREHGPIRNLELRAELGADDERAFDRLLQKARKAGLIECVGSQWSASDVETDAAKIARLTHERDAISSERDCAAAARDQMQRAMDLAAQDRSTLEAERARLAMENERLNATADAVDAALKRARGELREFVGTSEEIDLLSADRDTLSAKLTALAAEHESAARAAEEKILLLFESLSGAVKAMQLWGAEGDGVPEDGPIGEAYDAANAALAMVSP